MILFSDRVERNVRASTGLRHTLRLIHDLVTVSPVSRGTDLGLALSDFERKNSRRSVAFVISDFLTGRYDAALRSTSRRHDVVPVVIRDRGEMELPDGGLLHVTDPENGRQFTFDSFSSGQRRDYRAMAEAHAKERERLFRRLQLRWIDLWTGEDPLPALRQFLDRRRGTA
jgi:uncharacterized protein (DUF58 family)